MNTTAIAVINGQTLQVSNDEQQLVPIKPICMALGVNYTTQLEKIQNHPVFGGAVVPLRGITGADGKQYEMKCLPLEYIFGWIFSISPANVSEEARQGLIRYQQECNHALFEYFTRGMRREHELLIAENDLLKQRDEISQNIAYTKSETVRLKGLLNEVDAKLVEIRNERHNPQPSLFD